MQPAEPGISQSSGLVSGLVSGPWEGNSCRVGRGAVLVIPGPRA
jgi:hypothetical protein